MDNFKSEVDGFYFGEEGSLGIPEESYSVDSLKLDAFKDLQVFRVLSVRGVTAGPKIFIVRSRVSLQDELAVTFLLDKVFKGTS